MCGTIGHNCLNFTQKKCKGGGDGYYDRKTMMQFMIQLNWKTRKTLKNQFPRILSLGIITIKTHTKEMSRPFHNHIIIKYHTLVLTLKQDSQHRRNHRVLYIPFLTWKPKLSSSKSEIFNLDQIIIYHEGVTVKYYSFCNVVNTQNKIPLLVS